MQATAFREIRCWQLCIVAFTLIGCAQWQHEPSNEPTNLLNKPTLSADSVIVETVVVRFPREQADSVQQVWKVTDESVFDVQLRRRLAQNGLRCGIIMGDLPAVISQRLHELSDENHSGSLQQTGLAADVDSFASRLQCRAGRRRDVPVRRDLSGSLTVLWDDNGKTTGATFEQASLLFDLRVIPHEDGRATLKLTPEIQHGESRKQIVSSDFGVRSEMSREKAAWEPLTLSSKLSEGKILVISCANHAQVSNLGRAFFMTRTAEQTEEQAMLLVRLTQTQLDGLFAPDAVEAAKAIAER